MSISFSGLASGLDTSSWVESLTALKRAKVTELEEKREVLQTTKEAISSIKSFFSSFRSTIEKITYCKTNDFLINNSNTANDIFAQKLATSANLDVLTATATHEAVEGSYDVKVDQLATASKAISGFNFLTTIVETTTATCDSFLKHLGVKAGDILVTNSQGTQSQITITDNDTIGSFIQKLDGVGVKASFNENTGVFSVNLDWDDVNDIGNTKIREALHLQDVNEGYESSHLQVKEVETVWNPALGSTKLSELGVSAGTVQIEANGATYDFNITSTTTLQNFISSLGAKNIEANLDSEGIFTIKDAVIVDDGTTNLIDKFGLTTDINSKSQSSNGLTYETVQTDVTLADLSTKLVDLGEGVTITETQTVTVKNANNETKTINVTNASTLGDLLTGLNDAGLSATLKTDGTVEISGGTITGGTFDVKDVLGLNEEAYTSYVTGGALTETIENTQLATLDTRLVEDLGVSAGYFKVTKVDDSVSYLKVQSGETIQDLITKLDNAGIQASFDESTGRLNISGASKVETLTDSQVTSLVSAGTITESNTALRKGTDLLSKLYGQTTIDTTNATILQANTQSEAIYQQVTTTINAVGSTTLEQLGLGSQTSATFAVGGTTATVAISKTMTVDQFVAAAQSAGIGASFDEETSRISFDGAVLQGTNASGTLYSICNSTTSVSSKYATSNAVYAKTIQTVLATEATKLSELGITSQQEVVLHVPANAKAGASTDWTYTFTVNGTTTIDGLLTELNRLAETNATFENGVLKLEGGYITNSALESALGLERESTGVSSVLGQEVTYTQTASVTGATTLGDIITSLGTTSAVSGGYNLKYGNTSLAVSSTTTVDQLISLIHAQGGTAQLDSTGRLQVNGSALTGTVATALGITSTTTTAGVSCTGDALTVEKQVTVTEDTLISDTYVPDYSEKMPIGNIEIYDYATTIGTVTITSTTTYGQWFEDLARYGIDASIKNGTITITSSNGNVVGSGFLDYFEWGAYTNTSTADSTTWTSTAAITYTQTVTADTSTTLEEVLTARGTLASVEAGGTIALNFVADNGTVVDCITNDAVTTLGDVINTINANGGNAWLDSAGKLQVTGGRLTGSVADGMGITSSTTTIACGVTSTYTMTSQVTEYADTNTKLSELGLGASVVTIGTPSTSIDEVAGYITTYSEMTIGDLFNRLADYGIGGSISNGVITLTPASDDKWAYGGVLESMGIGLGDIESSYPTIAITRTSGTIKYDKTVTNMIETTQTVTVTSTSTITVDQVTTSTVEWVATEDTLLRDLGVTDFSTIGFDYSMEHYTGHPGGEEKTFSNTTTLGDLIDWINNDLNDYIQVDNQNGSITATLTSIGVLTVKTSGCPNPFFYKYEEGYDDTPITSSAGSIINVLGLNNITTVTDTIRVSHTSASEITYIKPVGQAAYTDWKATPFGELSFLDAFGAQTFKLKVYNVKTGAEVAIMEGAAEDENVVSALDSFINDEVGGCISYKVEDTVRGSRLVITPAEGYYITCSALCDGGYLDTATTLTMETTLGELGLGTEVITKTASNGAVTNYTFYSDSTLQDIEDTIGGRFNMFLTDGKLTLKATQANYSWSSDFANALGLSSTCNYYTVDWELSSSTELKDKEVSTTVTPVEQTITSTGTEEITVMTTQISTTEALINSSTLFSELGMTEKGYITICSNGTTYTITINPESTVGDMQISLLNKGMQVDIADGKVTFKSTDPRNVYIYGASDNIENIFGVGFNDIGGTWTNEAEHFNCTMDSSNTLQVTTTQAVTGETRIGDLLYNGTTFAEAAGGTGGVWYLDTNLGGYTFGFGDNINQVIESFEFYGIHATLNANGTLSLSSDEYTYFSITELDPNRETLKFFFGSQNAVSSTATTSSSSSSVALKESNTVVLNEDTVLSTIGVTSGVFDIRGEGSITIDATKTLGYFFGQLKTFGYDASVVDGKVIISKDGLQPSLQEGYVNGVSSNIVDKLKLGSSKVINQQEYYSYTLRTTEPTVTVSPSGTDTLATLRSGGSLLTQSSAGNFSVVLSTTADGATATKTLTFAATSTVNDVITELSKYGINASMNSEGKFTMTSTVLDDFSLTDVSGGGNLAASLTKNATKTYLDGTTNNLSSVLSKNETVLMSDTTKLSDIGVTSGTVTYYNNGTIGSFTIDATTQTIADVRAQLQQAGFNSSIIGGRLSLQADGVAYLVETGSSNFIEQMYTYSDLWTIGDYTQEGEKVYISEGSINYADMNTKLSDLINSSGTNLGITGGTIYAYKNGTKNLITIDSTETLNSLASKLSQYGISVGMSSDGKITFTGNGDSYLTTDGITSGATNLLSKIGVTSWNTTNSSTSGVLSYRKTDEVVTDGSVKIVEMRAVGGGKLEVMGGEYYIYSNGVRYTETITGDTTVNDFIGTLKNYGIQANLNSDGTISLGASNNSYIASAGDPYMEDDVSDIVTALFGSEVAGWDVVTSDTSNSLSFTTTTTAAITRETKLSDVNGGTYTAGKITVVQNGVEKDITLTADDTVGTFLDQLKLYGFDAVVNEAGQISVRGTGDSYIKSGGTSNVLELLDIAPADWVSTNLYTSETVDVVTTTTLDAAVTRDTALSELGVTTGEYYIYKDGVKYTALVSSDETMGSFMDTLESFGIQSNIVDNGTSGVLQITGAGDTYITKSNSTTNASNIAEKLFPTANNDTTYDYSGKLQTSTLVTSYTDATEETLISDLNITWDNANKAQGVVSVKVDGADSTISIGADETLGSFMEKLETLGIEASLSNGVLMIQSGFKDFTINTAGTTSALVNKLGLVYNPDMGGYMASSMVCEQTISTVEERTISVANYADLDTKMSLLNISSGTFTVYRDGQKATVQLDASESFEKLQEKINDELGANGDIRFSFNNGILEISSASGAVVEVGTNSDNSNISSICGFINDGSGIAKSSRELYKVIGDSLVTQSGLFRTGDVTEGTFTIGNAVFTIDDTTTLNNLISQINSSQESGATAYWDSVDGKLVINARDTGATFVNIEAGDYRQAGEAGASNFTDILGLTSSEWDGSGNLTSTALSAKNQEIGTNAVFSINGTSYTSTSNTIDSSISRIQGLTINLKDVSEGETVTITVEQDTQSIANVVSDVVDAYNELIKNVDKAVAMGGTLNDESTLKFIRNEIRTLMTSSLGIGTTFKNLDSIGISLEAASSGNIKTDDINLLHFDKNKFIECFKGDSEAVKTLLVGTESADGIFAQIERTLDNALDFGGYFDRSDKSYSSQISNINTKIQKQNQAVERYKARLETKFQAMDLLISKMQNQYSSFLAA